MNSISVTLTSEDIETLLVSLKYSQQRVADAQGTPYEVRKENLARLDAVALKLREARIPFTKNERTP